MDDVGSLEIRWIQGFTNKNVTFVDTKTVCYTCGAHVCFLNLETGKQSVFQSPGGACVGALTADGRTGIFAFSEQKLSPSIFLYGFPELQLKSELIGGTQLDYTSLALSDGGPYLASCSSLPDYTITVWNWENAVPVCTQPQAGEDVISLVFNPFNWLQLCALGTTSFTVWQIENIANVDVLKPRVVELPATNGSVVEGRPTSSHDVRDQLQYLVPGMPLSRTTTRATVTPSAICWTTTSELYVGCVEGFLLLVDTESLSVSVLFTPTTADAIPELRNCSIEGLTLHESGLMVLGKENMVHCLQIRGTQLNVTQTWQLERPANTVMLSPDNETLLLSSNEGRMYMLNPTQSDKIVKVLDIFSGNFVTAALSHTDSNICVSLRDSGELQLWSSDGTCLGSLSVQAQVTSLACCPIAHYAAVGTTSGDVIFIDLNMAEQPRLVHQVHLYHAAVDHLVFDPEGHYLFTSGSDSFVYILDAKPSRMFSVMGYAVIPGKVLSLSTQCFRDLDEVKVLALCTGQEDKNEDGSLFKVLSLPTRNLAGSDCIERHGCLSAHFLKVFTYKVPHPLESCALGISEVFAYCHKKKNLQRFQLPETSISNQEVVDLQPEQEVKGHPLGPASLLLSPNCLQLASVGRDGLLRIRQTASMEQYIEMQCHSCHLGGVRSVSFSTDGHTLVTTGVGDGSLVCTTLRIKAVDAVSPSKQCITQSLKSLFSTENPILINFPAWSEASPGVSKNTEESQVRGGASVDVTEQDEMYKSQLQSPSLHPTWLESKQQAVIKEDNEHYSDTKKKLRKAIKDLRDTIQKMLRENENLPEEQFNLDVVEQKILKTMVEEEVARTKSEIAQDIEEKCHRRDVLKRECWDSVTVKGRAIKAFHSGLYVQNYPLKERTEEELEDLRRVHNIRKLEKPALSSLENTQEENQLEEDHEATSFALTGSFSAQLGYSDPYIYDQFILQTTEQRNNQIIMLQGVIYRIKTAFNADFEALHRQKVQELKYIGDRNRRIRDIMLELDINQELWEPSLIDSEWPERVLTVDNSEIKAEKYLTLEQEEEEERRKLEEERQLTAQGDGSREKALDDMMKGELEVKKVEILKMEIPLPEFALTKPNNHWSEEEKKVYKEYEEKAKALSEEKEKYKRSLELEIKRLQESTKDTTENFDETLSKLKGKKGKCTFAIKQEELKIAHLVDSVLKEEELKNQEPELKHQLDKTLAHKGETDEEVKRCQDELDKFHEEYDSLVAQDKVLDKDFRKNCFDIQNHPSDQLYKLFKRRPRTPLCGSLGPNALNQMLNAMEELDAPENMPEGMCPAVWMKLCVARREKVESEQKVKTKALTLAQMQACLQRRRQELNSAQQHIENLSKALESLQKERNPQRKNTMVQVILKQGQVEASTKDLTPGSTDADLILYHKSVVDKLRGSIRMLAEQKITSMEERKEVHKCIIQLEWEHRVERNKIEDILDKEKSIKMLRLSEEQQDMTHYNKAQHASRMSDKVSNLEESIALMEKANQRCVEQRMEKIEWINKKADSKERKNATLEQQHPEMQVTVAELRHICEAAAPEDSEAAETEERYQEIVQMSNLKDLAGAQEEDLAALWAELERLRMKNFPSLPEMNDN
ncbi:cilia- and flagella-associated protein 43 [Cololabis saira]|uniref:cilia- and flagella-associated protein 43 n=1 Tax=Cololabis saira TaxID=129043 RepID=UPI002AD46FB9|nr:cilia- and flagella-associated protein 43 [Cololabis saira]